MKMKDLNPAEEGYFPCKLQWLELSQWEFNGEYNNGNCIIIGLAFLELGKVLSRAYVIEPVFWLMRFGCIKTQRQKTGLCRLKG